MVIDEHTFILVCQKFSFDIAIFKKCFIFISLIWLIPQHLTIYWCEDKKYFRPFFVANPVCAFILVFSVYELWDAETPNAGYYFYYFFPIFIILSVVAYFTTKNDLPPFYEPVYVFGALVLSIIWIKSIADEIVGILDAMGRIFGIPAGIMGVTVLAWGNSVGDFVSNVSIARKGLPEAAIAACYSAPVFNLLFSLGIALSVKSIESGTLTFKIIDDAPDLTNITFYSMAYSMLAILLALVVVPLSRFKFPKILGGTFIAIYMSYLILCVLDVQNIILNNVYIWYELGWK